MTIGATNRHARGGSPGDVECRTWEVKRDKRTPNKFRRSRRYLRGKAKPPGRRRRS